MLLSNVRGFSSKSASWTNILGARGVTVGLLNETNVKNKRKIKQKKYVCFTKNHPTKKSMGGLCTMVDEALREQTVRVSDCSDGDEFLVVRLEHVEPALNVINLYGMQEGREGEEGKQKVLESWGRLRKELLLIEGRGEAALVMGDLNRAVGTGELGVPGNKERVSYGGEMVRELLYEGEYVLLNGLELAVGGPWTRVDPATGGLSCLDLALTSACLVPYLKAFVVDSERLFTPCRAVRVKGSFKYIYTDHYSVEAEFLMPTSKETSVPETTWNVYKPGGFVKYRELTERYSEQIEKIVDCRKNDNEEMMKKVDVVQNKIKFEAFGKTKVKKKINSKDEKMIAGEEEGARAMSMKRGWKKPLSRCQQEAKADVVKSSK